MSESFSPVQWLKVLYWIVTYSLGPKERRRKLTRLFSRSKYYDPSQIFSLVQEKSDREKRNSDLDAESLIGLDILLCIPNKGILLCGWTPFHREELQSLTLEVGSLSFSIRDRLNWHSRPDAFAYQKEKRNPLRNAMIGFGIWVPSTEITGEEKSIALRIKRDGFERVANFPCIDRFENRPELIVRIHSAFVGGALPEVQFNEIIKSLSDLGALKEVGEITFHTYPIQDNPSRKPKTVLIPMSSGANTIKFQLENLFSISPLSLDDIEIVFVTHELEKLPHFREIAQATFDLLKIPFKLAVPSFAHTLVDALQSVMEILPGEIIIILGGETFPMESNWSSILQSAYSKQSTDGSALFSVKLENADLFILNKSAWKKIGGLNRRLQTLEVALEELKIRARRKNILREIDINCLGYKSRLPNSPLVLLDEKIKNNWGASL